MLTSQFNVELELRPFQFIRVFLSRRGEFCTHSPTHAPLLLMDSLYYCMLTTLDGIFMSSKPLLSSFMWGITLLFIISHDLCRGMKSNTAIILLAFGGAPAGPPHQRWGVFSVDGLPLIKRLHRLLTGKIIVIIITHARNRRCTTSTSYPTIVLLPLKINPDTPRANKKEWV